MTAAASFIVPGQLLAHGLLRGREYAALRARMVDGGVPLPLDITTMRCLEKFAEEVIRTATTPAIAQMALQLKADALNSFLANPPRGDASSLSRTPQRPAPSPVQPKFVANSAPPPPHQQAHRPAQPRVPATSPTARFSLGGVDLEAAGRRSPSIVSVHSGTPSAEGSGASGPPGSTATPRVSPKDRATRPAAAESAPGPPASVPAPSQPMPIQRQATSARALDAATQIRAMAANIDNLNAVLQTLLHVTAACNTTTQRNWASVRSMEGAIGNLLERLIALQDVPHRLAQLETAVADLQSRTEFIETAVASADALVLTPAARENATKSLPRLVEVVPAQDLVAAQAEGGAQRTSPRPATSFRLRTHSDSSRHPAGTDAPKTSPRTPAPTAHPAAAASRSTSTPARSGDRRPPPIASPTRARVVPTVDRGSVSPVDNNDDEEEEDFEESDDDYVDDAERSPSPAIKRRRVR